MSGIEDANTDALLDELGGCGRFQVYLMLISTLASIPGTFTYLVNTFGMYNPGWRCAENDTVTSTFLDGVLGNDTVTSSHRFNHSGQLNTSMKNDTAIDDVSYKIYSCHGFDSCDAVEFSLDAMTMVTEWGLACDLSWVVSSLVSIQMAGNFVGTAVCGYVGDRFGRKTPMHVGIAFVAGLNIISYFSVSWQMYGVILFFMGFWTAFSMLGYVLVSEYVPGSWRVKVNSLPIWTINSILFTLLAMYFRDWKILRLFAGVLGVLIFVLVFWMPKSLRFLSVKGRQKEALYVVKKISKTNRVDLPDKKYLEALHKNDDCKKINTTIFHIFRKGYIIWTIIIGILCFCIDLSYFAFSYGITKMPGNFYLNFIIFALADLPANALGYTVAGVFTRKPSICLNFVLSALCLFVSIGFEFTTSGLTKDIAIQVCVLTAKVFLYVGWMVMIALVMELYPTIVRSNVQSYVMLTSNVGSILAPFMVPADSSGLYIRYIAIGALMALSAVLVIFMPETKGKLLCDTWEECDQRWNSPRQLDAVKYKKEKGLKNGEDDDTVDVMLGENEENGQGRHC